MINHFMKKLINNDNFYKIGNVDIRINNVD